MFPCMCLQLPHICFSRFLSSVSSLHISNNPWGTNDVTSLDLETPSVFFFLFFIFLSFYVPGMYPSGFDYMAPPPPYPGPPQNWTAPPQNWTATPTPPPGLILSRSVFIFFLLCMSVSLHPSDLICLPQSESLRITPPKRGAAVSSATHQDYKG